MSQLLQIFGNKKIELRCSVKKCNSRIEEGEAFFCLGCSKETILCIKCNKVHIENNDDHETMAYEEYKNTTFFIKYHQFNPTEDFQKHNKKMDKRNKLLYVDSDQKVITYGKKWGKIGLSDTDPFLAVSFVGFSGVGKSTIIGPLCKNSQYPIPGSSYTSSSTSSDINSFIGETHEKLKYVIIDSEGIGGSSSVATLESGGDGSTTMESSAEIRLPFVRYAYPRLLYLFSDVLVFTHSGERQKATVFESLMFFSKVSSSITNNLIRPHLIILFNKHGLNERFDNDLYANQEYFGKEQAQLDQLNIYYQSVSILYLPNINERSDISIKRYNNQAKKLTDLIDQKLAESLKFKKDRNFSTDKSENLNRISTAIGFFNKTPEGIPDMVSLNSTGIRRKSMIHELIAATEESTRSREPPRNSNQQVLPRQLSFNTSTTSPSPPSSTLIKKQTPTANQQGAVTNSPFLNKKPLPVPSQSPPSPTLIKKQAPITNQQGSVTNSPPKPPLISKSSPNVSTTPPLPTNSTSKLSHSSYQAIQKPTPTTSPTTTQTPSFLETKRVKSFDSSIKSPLGSIHTSSTYNTTNHYSLPIIRPRNSSDLISNDIPDEKISLVVLYLFTYFKEVYSKTMEKSEHNRIKSYQESMGHLKSRLYDTHNKFLKRNSIKTLVPISVCQSFNNVLKELSDQLDEFIPCNSSHSDHGYSCINLKNTHSIHQSKECTIEKISIGVFGAFSKALSVPHRWDGTFSPDSTHFDLSAYLQENIVSFSNENPTFTVPKYGIKSDILVCFGCLLDSPYIPYDCGHLLCLDCSKESDTSKCSVQGCQGKTTHLKPIDYIPSMGVRILSLDGGGIRGIVECVALKVIQDHLFGIEIDKLFDLIVGTSTGGLIAIATVSTNKTASQLINTFENMAKKAFVTVWFNKALFWRPKYNRNKLQECLNEEIGKNKPFKDTFSRTRVAVTSATPESGGFGECLFSNYLKRVSPSEVSKLIYGSDCVSACEATSAAPSYFAPFQYEGRQYIDGGVGNNNPCKVAMKEYKALWVNKNVDILVSLGTGTFKKSTNITDTSNIFKFLGQVIHLLTNSENSWYDIKNSDQYNLKENSNSFRVNIAIFDKSIGLDAIDEATIKLLKDTAERAFSFGNPILNEVINKSLSSLFYICSLQYHEKEGRESLLIGEIKFRLDSIDHELVKQFEKKDPFYLDNQGKDTKFKIVNNTITSDNPFGSISFEIVNPPDRIDIICTLVSLNKVQNSTSISGSPFSIKNDRQYYNIKTIG